MGKARFEALKSEKMRKRAKKNAALDEKTSSAALLKVRSFKLVRQLFVERENANVAEFDRVAVAEETEETGFVLEARVFGVVDRFRVRNVGVDDELAVDDDFNERTDGDDFFGVPFAGRCQRAGFRRNDAVDGAVLLPVGGARVVRVQDLEFHPVVGGVFAERGADADAVVALRREFEIEAENEVAVLFFRQELSAFTADERIAFDRVTVDASLPNVAGKGFAVEEEFEAEFFFLRGELVEFLRLNGGRESANAGDEGRDQEFFHR